MDTVLLVDDEEIMRRAMRRLLQRMGFEVLEATGGAQALELLRGQANELAGVLLDLTMPEMSGHQTFDALRKIAPDLPVVLCSGYGSQVARELLENEAVGFLQKPFDSEELRAALERAMAGRRFLPVRERS